MQISMLKRTRQITYLGLLGLSPECDAALSATLSSGWDSRYVNEGRDDGNEHSIVWIEAGLDWEQFCFTQLSMDGEDFKEHHSSLFYLSSLAEFEYGLGINVVTLESDSDDLELHLEIGREDYGFTWGLAAVHSKNMDGQFLMLSIEREFKFLEGRLSLIPNLHQGFDFGYRTDAYDGFSHVEAGIACHYQLSEHLEVNAYVAHSWAQSDLNREGGSDLSWGGFAIAAGF